MKCFPIYIDESLRDCLSFSLHEQNRNHLKRTARQKHFVKTAEYNKNEINVRNLINSFELTDHSMLESVEYEIKNLFWI